MRGMSDARIQKELATRHVPAMTKHVPATAESMSGGYPPKTSDEPAAAAGSTLRRSSTSRTGGWPGVRRSGPTGVSMNPATGRRRARAEMHRNAPAPRHRSGRARPDDECVRVGPAGAAVASGRHRASHRHHVEPASSHRDSASDRRADIRRLHHSAATAERGLSSAVTIIEVSAVLRGMSDARIQTEPATRQAPAMRSTLTVDGREGDHH